jgi:hypothetical protein
MLQIMLDLGYHSGAAEQLSLLTCYVMTSRLLDVYGTFEVLYRLQLHGQGVIVTLLRQLCSEAEGATIFRNVG